MAKPIPEKELQAIEAVVAAHPEGIGIQEIKDELEEDVVRRTLQYRLKHLVDEGRLVKEGEKRWTKYRLPSAAEKAQAATPAEAEEEPAVELPISKESAEIQEYVRKPVRSREHAGYKRSFLDQYRPNETAYLSDKERAHLTEVGSPSSGEQAAGTYAKQILNRLLIDLSWNSSRLEGNTYSLLDTKRLIDFGEEAEGKEQLEAQMILNHKDAIEFLVGSADEIGFNRHTILNLHALLANNLLADPDATGRLRQIAVGIERSAFHPLEVPQMIEECFDQILATAEAIEDPFEQAFFVMVQLPYLQPFDDVNKRVSRLAANIPLIKANLTPLSFTDVPAKTYTEAVLGVYELNRIDLLKDVFIWAYERSASRYAAVRQSLGEPDPFRLKHRAALRDIVQNIVLERLDKKAAFGRIAAWSAQNIKAGEQDQFREIAESEVLGLHEGNFARYQIRPSEFQAWQKVWAGKTEALKNS
ncbi:Fic family protein [Hyphomonas sp. UBA3201]|uniref:Fic family protein n=1 Tax=Hyphomonas sp. UBA3201 TaxID=1946623 RepID=UPI0025B88F2F|nr:Fic family protein [Hyphomonas sp. UBA3201]